MIRILLLVLSWPLAIQAATVRFDELNLGLMTSGWGTPQKNQSVTQTPLSIGGEKFAHGVGTHAESECAIVLDGQAQSFSAKVGVDDNAKNQKASLEFVVSGDDRVLWRSGVCKLGDKPRDCQVKLAGVKRLLLTVTDAGDGINFDHADWAEAAFTTDGAPPKVETPPLIVEEPFQLTPPAPVTPRLTGPKVYGVRPGSPFLYRIPCTGTRPVTFLAQRLPAGLKLDGQTGIITGKIDAAGTFQVTLRAKNAHGDDQREFRIIVGQQLALTPPMGWNSWYIHYNRVTDKTMRAAADQMIASGMADYGYQYVNIDDCWMNAPNSAKYVKDQTRVGPMRNEAGVIQPNGYFPDMQGLAAYIHSKGLKAGLYTSPGPLTCAQCAGSYEHEAQDAKTFAEWGFDFLKYDWCSYSRVAKEKTLDEYQRPYKLMWSELQKLDRDIVFNLCQYGMGDVWKWGGTVGHCWRTTGDLGLEKSGTLPGFYSIGFSNAKHWEYAKPGAWNDPDYILIGWVGNAHGMGEGQATKLTPNEQYSYMSMWSLMAAPLIFSGDMAKLDAFTLNVLCNHEVIDIDQDPLGKQAKIIRQSKTDFVLLKELEDGSVAVGLFNLDRQPAKIAVTWAELGLTGPQKLRDVWQQKNLDVATDRYETTIARHGVKLLKLAKPKQ